MKRKIQEQTASSNVADIMYQIMHDERHFGLDVMTQDLLQDDKNKEFLLQTRSDLLKKVADDLERARQMTRQPNFRLREMDDLLNGKDIVLDAKEEPSRLDKLPPIDTMNAEANHGNTGKGRQQAPPNQMDALDGSEHSAEAGMLFKKTGSQHTASSRSNAQRRTSVRSMNSRGQAAQAKSAKYDMAAAFAHAYNHRPTPAENAFLRHELAAEEVRLEKIRKEAHEQQKQLMGANDFFRFFAEKHRSDVQAKIKRAYGKGPHQSAAHYHRLLQIAGAAQGATLSKKPAPKFVS